MTHLKTGEGAAEKENRKVRKCGETQTLEAQERIVRTKSNLKWLLFHFNPREKGGSFFG